MDADSQNLYARLLRHTRPYWKTFAVSILATAVIGITEPAIPAILGPMLDGSFVNNNTDSALYYSLLLVGLFFVRGISQYTSTIAMSWVGFKVMMDLREAMFRKLIDSPTPFFDRENSGGLMSKFTYDASQISEATTTALVILVRDSITIVGLLAFMLYTDWKLTLIFFIIIPAVALIVKTIARRQRRLMLSVMESTGDMSATLDETIRGQKEIKLFGGQQQELSRFHEVVNWVRRYHMKFNVTSAASVPTVQLLSIIALGAIINLAAGRQPPMSVGTFVAFFGAMGLLLTPVKRLTGVNESLQRGMAAAQTVFTLIDEPAEQDSGSQSLPRARGKLEFEHLGFRYHGTEQDALTDINLTIEPGETIALVGQSGSGKSTLAGLIPRFYQPDEGRILIDGIDIQDIKLADLRHNLSLVSQHVVLFNDTIAANIAYGDKRTADEAEIIAAAEKAHAMEFIRELPDGLQALCGQNGVRLSGGQRQRIAIARALLKDAPILILDEATSALDTESEQKVQQALEELMQGRTTITIAHRLSTIQKADRIVVLDQGRVVESGSHEELLHKGGRYAELYRIQFAGQEN
jgi:subfamily B ATP-binding cassette protein MsbA